MYAQDRDIGYCPLGKVGLARAFSSCRELGPEVSSTHK
jgi:hypothetical protein